MQTHMIHENMQSWHKTASIKFKFAPACHMSLWYWTGLSCTLSNAGRNCVCVYMSLIVCMFLQWEGEQVVMEEFPEATIMRPSDIFGMQDRFLHYYMSKGDSTSGLHLARMCQGSSYSFFMAVTRD